MTWVLVRSVWFVAVLTEGVQGHPEGHDGFLQVTSTSDVFCLSLIAVVGSLQQQLCGLGVSEGLSEGDSSGSDDGASFVGNIVQGDVGGGSVVGVKRKRGPDTDVNSSG